MAEITAALVKDLRDRTGAGMMDCKKALIEAAGDAEAAIDWLRKKGLSAAAKKAGRTAAEGLIGVASAPGRAAIVEVNAETDFVARNPTFQAFVSAVAAIALEVGESVEAITAAPFPGSGRSVAEELTQMVATIGENMNVRRARVLAVPSGAVATYIHSAVAPGALLGKIGVIVGVGGETEVVAMEQFGRLVGMHVAATNPLSLGHRLGRSGSTGAGACGADRTGARQRQAGGGDPEDGRGTHSEILRRSRSAGAGVGA